MEKQIVGSIIDNPDRLVHAIGVISTADFEDYMAGMIFGVACDMWRDQTPIDLITVISKCKEIDPAYISSATGNFISDNLFISYIGMISEKSSVKRIRMALRDIYEQDLDSIELLGGISSVFDSESSISSSSNSMSELITDFDRNVEHAKKHGLGIDTGFQFFEAKGIKYMPCHTWILGGFTSVGKTATLVEMISRVDTLKNRVVVISTEMTKDQNVGRLLANSTGFASNVIMSGNLYSRNIEKLDSAKKTLSEQNISVYDDIFEISEIESVLVKAHMQGGVDIVFLDYLQNCSVKDSKSEYQEMATLAKRLQKLSKRINATIVCLSQVSNSAAKDDGGIMQFKGAGEFAAVADVAIMLRRSKENKQQILLDVVKHRHGAKGKQVLEYASGWTRLEECHHADNE